jgi:regulatory protein
VLHRPSAGHDYALARRWVDAAPGDFPEAED